MSELLVHKVNAFTNEGSGGNGAGLVLDADSLNNAQMQHIAAEVGYSETAFVVGQQGDTFRVRYFTPTNEVDLCGHATIATGHMLKIDGRLTGDSFNVVANIGSLLLRVEQDGKIIMQLPGTPVLREEFEVQPIADILGVGRTAIEQTGLKPQLVSIGTNELIVPIVDVETLGSLKPDLAALVEHSKVRGTLGMHVFSLDNVPEGADAVCRNFDPLNGIDEESATGSSSCALGYYLSQHGHTRSQYTFLQGLSMPNPSRLFVTVSDEGAVGVGGYAVKTSEELYSV